MHECFVRTLKCIMLLWQVRGVTDEFGCFGEGPTNGFYPGPSPPGLIPGGGGLSQEEEVMISLCMLLLFGQGQCHPKLPACASTSVLV